MSMIANASTLEILAAALLAIAIIHTFSAKYFEHLAHVSEKHAGLFHLLGEVETVFGLWALALLTYMAAALGPAEAIAYLESRDFTEPAFVFVVVVMAASKPVIDFMGAAMLQISRLLPMHSGAACYFTLMSLGPLLGSAITEPAAMTLCAMLLQQRYFGKQATQKFLYGSIGVLFVNVSIGGTLTHFAAPPVLMVAERWDWGAAFMFKTFGWKAALAVAANAALATFVFRNALRQSTVGSGGLEPLRAPVWVIAIHLGFVALAVAGSHHAVVFLAVFLFFLGFTEAYKNWQSQLLLREGLLVGFFLAGLVVLGGQQRWWLQPLLADREPMSLFVGAVLLTAIADNAALTYLGSQVEGVSDAFKYALVAGAVTGGGLTVIANAPNPAGFAILRGSFEEGSISALRLAVAALPPTLVAAAAFLLL